MLNVNAINQFYGGGSHILRDVSFTAPMGACTVLLGRNGVGKTTLLRAIMGVVPVRTGTITFDGQDVTSLPSNTRVARGMAYVPQGREIFARLTVEENLLMGMATLPARQAAGIGAEVYELFPVLKEMLQRRGGDLSGGRQPER